MRITRAVSPYLASNMYAEIERGAAVVVDPGDDGGKAVGDARVVAILLTHEHSDHLSGANAYRERYACPIVCTRLCAERAASPRQNLSEYFDAFLQMEGFAQYRSGSAKMQPFGLALAGGFEREAAGDWLGHAWRLFATPGHSAGSMCILLDQRALFTGDTLLKGRETATGLPGGSARELAAVTVPRLTALDRTLRVYPGHFAPFRLGDSPMLAGDQHGRG